jgi:hypothetical protein
VSQPEGGRRFTSQPDQRPTRQYEPQLASTSTSHTSRRFRASTNPCDEGGKTAHGAIAGLGLCLETLTHRALTCSPQRSRSESCS